MLSTTESAIQIYHIKSLIYSGYAIEFVVLELAQVHDIG